MTEGTETSTTLAGRLRKRLRSFEPIYLAALSLLAIPGYVFESLAIMKLFGVFLLVFFWPFVAPLVEAVLRRGTDEEAAEPTDWIHMGNWREYAAWLLTFPLGLLNPLVLTEDPMQWLGTGVAAARYRGSVPDAEGYEQRRSYRLPFDGPWTVVNGSHHEDYSHSWFPVNQRYAYDFVITDADGRTRPDGTDATVDSYYCYDEPILAPADGVVVDVYDEGLESSRAGGVSHPLKRDIRGSYVVIQHAQDEYSCLAHLVPGSVTVDPGDRVDRGEEIGRCGHSGNSSEPHLHFQVQDRPDFRTAASLPIAFDDVALEWPGVEAPITDPLQTESDAAESEPEGGDEDEGGTRPAIDVPSDVAGAAHLEDGTVRARAHLTAGQRVAHVGGSGDSARGRDETHDATSAIDAATFGDASSGRHAGLVALQRIGFGTCVGGTAVFFGSIVLAPLTVAVLLGVGAAIVAAARVGVAVLRGGGGERLPTSIGTAVGVGVAAAVVAWAVRTEPALGVGPQGLGVVLLLLGFAGYAALAEYEGLRLRDSFADRDSTRSPKATE